MTPRTTEQLRAALAKGYDEAAVAEAVRLHGADGKEIRGLRPPFHWNHRICGAHITKDGRLWFDIYWQGDSTDGSDSVSAEDMRGGRGHVIRAEHFFDGTRTRERHGDIHVEREELDELAAVLHEWLAPEAVRRRDEAGRLYALKERVRGVISGTIRPRYGSRNPWDRDERYTNGTAAVLRYAELRCGELSALGDGDLAAAVEAVFLANRKHTRAFGRNADGIIYDLPGPKE